MRAVAVLFAAFAFAASHQAWACWAAAAQRYGVSAELLYAVARAESDLNPKAVNRAHLQKTGSYDIGLMQINSRHLPRLQRHGIAEADLYDPCVNLQVGAWLLADSFTRHGVTWNAVGAYNAACTQLRGDACTAQRNAYAWRVYRRLPRSGTAAEPASRALPHPVAAPAAVPLLAVRVAP